MEEESVPTNKLHEYPAGKKVVMSKEQPKIPFHSPTSHDLNVWDPRYGHPQVVEAGFYTTTFKPTYAKPDLTVEEVEAERSQFRGNVLPQIEQMAPDYDWKSFETDEGCPEEPDAPAVHMLVGIPKDVKDDEKLPAIFNIPGGGLTGGGTAELGAVSTIPNIQAAEVRVVQFYLEYRVAPADTYPAAINDCHAAYQWMIKHADELHINTDDVILYGGSTGGHLVLCMGFRLKRYGWCGGPMPHGIIAVNPAMGDVDNTTSMRYSYENPDTGDHECWDGYLSQMCFKKWLGDRFGDPRLSPEAVPNRATLDDVKGFPPVWIPCEGEFETARDISYKLAALLHEAGVFCELHVWGGTNHGFCWGGYEGDFANVWFSVIKHAIRDSIRYDFRRQWLWEQE
jgi:acetyl esterase/lipase